MAEDVIGFIGLGALGLPVAANLLAAGYQLRVHNRTAAKARPLIERGATAAERPVDPVGPRRGNIALKDIGLFVEQAKDVGAPSSLSAALLDVLRQEAQ